MRNRDPYTDNEDLLREGECISSHCVEIAVQNRRCEECNRILAEFLRKPSVTEVIADDPVQG